VPHVSHLSLQLSPQEIDGQHAIFNAQDLPSSSLPLPLSPNRIIKLQTKFTNWLSPLAVQAAHAKKVQELAVVQEEVAQEQDRLEAMHEDIEARRAELVAQVTRH
jgi:hypothetical protein